MVECMNIMSFAQGPELRRKREMETQGFPIFSSNLGICVTEGNKGSHTRNDRCIRNSQGSKMFPDPHWFWVGITVQINEFDYDVSIHAYLVLSKVFSYWVWNSLHLKLCSCLDTHTFNLKEEFQDLLHPHFIDKTTENVANVTYKDWVDYNFGTRIKSLVSSSYSRLPCKKRHLNQGHTGFLPSG